MARLRGLEAVDHGTRRVPEPETNPQRRSSHKPAGSTFSARHVAQGNERPCPQCARPHPLWECPKFKGLPAATRESRVRAWGRCGNCLSAKHPTGDCTSSRRCRACGGTHHTLLHPQREPSTGAPATVTATSTSVCAAAAPRRAILATARVRLVATNGRSTVVRALIDSGAEVNLITEAVVQRLRAPRRAVHIEVAGAVEGTTRSARSSVTLRLESTVGKPYAQSVEALVLSRLTAYQPPIASVPSQWEHVKGLEMADDLSHGGRIDVILGADVYAAILRPEIRAGRGRLPTAQRTRLGWILLGALPEAPEGSQAHCHSVHRIGEPIDELLRRFWEVEELPATAALSPAEAECEEHFVRTHRRDDQGRYEVRTPLRSKPQAELGESRPVARAALLRMEKRLAARPALREAYVQFMRDYIERGHMERVRENEETPGEAQYFLPHHPVQKETGAGPKVRVVFNASQKTTSGRSLNDIVHVGPRLQRDLREVLLAWRLHRIVFTADVEQMFRQIAIHPADRPLQRILWRETPAEPIATYGLKTVTYGTACAPYLANRVLLQLAADEQTRYPRAAELARRHTYVDDVLAGADTVREAQSLRAELVSFMEAGGFHLRKWASNSAEVLATVPMSDREPMVRFTDEGLGGASILGIHWLPTVDSFGYTVSAVPQGPATKRTVLSATARLFDPLGWISPVTVVGKIMLQELWIAGVEWDEPLPEFIAERWREFRDRLPELAAQRLPRWVGRSPHDDYQLYGFCDASERAYAAAVYLVVRNKDGAATSRLLAAKSKVAPVKRVSLPRLELCGAHLLARLLHFARGLTKERAPAYCWTDSTVALAWIRGHPSRWTTFVANRVGAIHELLPETRWGHVPGAENPADCASRGLEPDRLRLHRLWWSGPEWLTGAREDWPTEQVNQDLDTPEQRRSAHAVIAPPEDWCAVQSAASYRKVRRVMAYVLRFVTRSPGETLALTAAELRSAETSLLRVTQGAFFREELRQLRNGGRLPASSSLRQLHPFLDEVGLLRMDGRLSYAQLPEDQRRPVILPRDARLTELLVREIHERTLHGGVQLTLAVLRERYWTPAGRALVRRVIYRCVICARYRGRTMAPLMAPLPRDRKTMAPPFARSGVDYAGPVSLVAHGGRGRRTYKGYIAVFVCFTTRAVHLELVGGCTTAAFLAAFQRFAARRGVPSTLYSDRGTTFIGADRELREQLRAINAINGPIANRLAEDDTEWKFIPPSAPHFGGLWEAGVRSVKHHLRRALGQQALTYEELSTWLSRVEACLNSRPLCPLSDDPSDLEALTPGHFLTGRPLCAIPEPSLRDVPESRLSRWQLLQKMTEHLWGRWSREYLAPLQARNKWQHAERPPRVGEMVVIADGGQPPATWVLGRIQELLPGTDGHIRVARVRTKDTILMRPLVKLVRLPVDGAATDSNPAEPTE